MALAPVDVVGLAAGVLTTVAFVPQVVRIVRTRSAYDISWWLFGILAAGFLFGDKTTPFSVSQKSAHACTR